MDESSNRYSERRCLKALQKATEILGKTPTQSEYRTTGLSPSPELISKRCGGWNLAIAKAGLDQPSRRDYTKEDCIRALQNFADAHGEEPTIESYKKSGYKPSTSTIIDLCGTWTEAKETADVVDRGDDELSLEEEVEQTFDLLG